MKLLNTLKSIVNRPNAPRPHERRLDIECLEARILFSGAPVDAPADAAPAPEPGPQAVHVAPASLPQASPDPDPAPAAAPQSATPPAPNEAAPAPTPEEPAAAGNPAPDAEATPLPEAPAPNQGQSEPADVATPTADGEAQGEATLLSLTVNPSAEDQAASQEEPLTIETLLTVADAAKERWAATGLTGEQLSALDSIDYRIEDLPSGRVGMTEGQVITIDTNAAERGWFIDSTPLQDEEFTALSPTFLIANEQSGAANDIDLVTVLMHEQGHVLGLLDESSFDQSEDLMHAYISIGQRKIAEIGQAEGAEPGTVEGQAFITASPVVTNASSPTSTSSQFANISGTAEDGATIRVYGDTNNNGQIDEGEKVVSQGEAKGGQFDFQFPLTKDSENNFLVTAQAKGDTESAPVDVPTITHGNFTSQPTINAPSAPQTVDATTFTISGSTQGGNTVRVYTDENNNGQIDGNDAVVGLRQLGPSSNSFNVTVPLAPDQDNNFLVTAEQSGQGESSPVNVQTIIEDPANPGLPGPTTSDLADKSDTGVSNSDNLTNATTVTIQAPAGSATPNSNVTLFIATPQGTTFHGPVATNGDGSWSETGVPLVEGSNIIRPSGTQGHSLVVTLDTTAPAVPTGVGFPTGVSFPTGAFDSGISTTDNITNIDRTNIAGDAPEQGATLIVTSSLDGVLTPDILQDGSWFLTVQLSEGTHSITAVAEDAAGNRSAASTPFVVTVDTTAPDAPTVTSSQTTVDSDSENVTGVAEADALVQVFADTDNDGAADPNTLPVAEVQLTGGNRTFSIPVNLTQNAANNFVVTATDTAGNVSSAADVPTITEAPAPAVVGGGGGDEAPAPVVRDSAPRSVAPAGEPVANVNSPVLRNQPAPSSPESAVNRIESLQRQTGAGVIFGGATVQDGNQAPALFGVAEANQRVVIRVFDADGDRIERITVRANSEGVWKVMLDDVAVEGALEFQVRIGGETRTFRFDPSDFGGDLDAGDGVEEDLFSGRLFREVNPDGSGFGKVSDRFKGSFADILNL